ncbi:hypothetical protein ACFL5S_00060 [Fibrobacterota bacterium]
MNIVLAIILLASVLGILIAIVWLAMKFPHRSSKEVPSLEKKVLIQLQRIRREFSKIARSQYNKNSYRFYKRIKLVLTVYMKERYGLTVNKTIDNETKRGLIARFKNSEEDIQKLQIFFNAMKRIKDEGMKHSGMCELYDSVILFFRNKVEKENE